ncbi:MAG: MogA/MoaB family molybdenum cofactor biosynthesis protein [Rhodothermales bacterium]|nr:MogA/MoaB family molybdenum cofactor biosynthesis protein [Rhodothermales bacterium]
MSHSEHEQLARDTPVRVAIVTVSDTRTEATDTSGGLMKTLLAGAGHPVVAYRIVPDEPTRIGPLLDELAGLADVILLNGGTGISRRDTTYEVVSGKLDKTLPGFGELFRMLSYDQIGSAAMLSRATAGVMGRTLVFSTPGSTNAVRLAMETLIVPQLAHLVWETVRQ